MHGPNQTFPPRLDRLPSRGESEQGAEPLASLTLPSAARPEHGAVPDRSPQAVASEAAIERIDAVMTRIRTAAADTYGAMKGNLTPERLQKIEADAAAYVLLWRQFGEGRTRKSLIREHGTTAGRWLKGGLPQSVKRADPEEQRRIEARVAVPSSASPELAYLLGAFAGRSRVGVFTRRLEFYSTDGAAIDRIAGNVAALFELTGKRDMRRIGKHERHHFRVISSALGEYFSKVTEGNRHLPWKHLLTSAERRAFLRGFITFAGGTLKANTSRFMVSRHMNPSLIEEVAVLMHREGLAPVVRGGWKPAIGIFGREDLRLLRTLGLVEHPVQRTELDRICSRRVRYYKPLRIYDHAMEVAKSLPIYPNIRSDVITSRLAKSDAGKATPAAIHGWLTGKRPHRADRREEIDALTRKVAGERSFTERYREAVLARLARSSAAKERKALAAELRWLSSLQETAPTEERSPARISLATALMMQRVPPLARAMSGLIARRMGRQEFYRLKDAVLGGTEYPGTGATVDLTPFLERLAIAPDSAGALYARHLTAGGPARAMRLVSLDTRFAATLKARLRLFYDAVDRASGTEDPAVVKAHTLLRTFYPGVFVRELIAARSRLEPVRAKPTAVPSEQTKAPPRYGVPGDTIREWLDYSPASFRFTAVLKRAAREARRVGLDPKAAVIEKERQLLRRYGPGRI